MNYREARHVVRAFIQKNYSDGDLVYALDRCRSGSMTFISCCCLIGIPTRDHVADKDDLIYAMSHWHKAYSIYGDEAQMAFHQLMPDYEFAGGDSNMDASRRLRLIPILKAEIRRRSRAMRIPEYELESVLVRR